MYFSFTYQNEDGKFIITIHVNKMSFSYSTYSYDRLLECVVLDRMSSSLGHWDEQYFQRAVFNMFEEK